MKYRTDVGYQAKVQSLFCRHVNDLFLEAWIPVTDSGFINFSGKILHHEVDQRFYAFYLATL